MKKARSFVNFLAIPMIVMLLAGCAMFEGRETTGEYVDDATITTKVKADIVGEPTLKVLQINVETMQGIVQLSGFVNSRRSEDKAVEIARHVRGVKSVKDNIIIR